MSRKIHLRRNKLTDTNSAIAACAARSIGNGKCLPNSRTTYRFMASEIVGPKEFRDTSHQDRCAHCVDAGLILMNKQRREKGKAPVATFNEGWA